jgi:pimeloyl-ACP methyl ester carboxylesterase
MVNQFLLKLAAMRLLLGLLLPGIILVACAKSADVPFSYHPQPREITPLMVGCDTCKYPLVLVHGFLASGDTYTRFQQLFTSNGYQPNLIHTFDWNSLNAGANNSAALDAFIDQVMLKTGASQVRLLGHSAGGGLCYTYLSNAARAAKVDGYVHIGSGVQAAPAGFNGTEPTLNVWSEDDEIVAGGDIPGASNAKIPGKDHYQVATSTESFAAIYQFFHHQPPPVLEIVPQNIVCIAGKVLTFGENTPQSNARVDIYPVDPETGQRLQSTPFETWYSKNDGSWGPTNVLPNTHYEFVVSTPGSGRIIHYFREAFTHLNLEVYLRTIPPPPSLAGILLAGLPNAANQTVLNFFSSSQAVVNTRDVLTVDGAELSTTQYASPAKTAISYFLYDDGDGQTALSPVGLFGGFSFLNGVDMFFPTAVSQPVRLVFNGRQLNVRKVPSNEGVVVAVFD